MPKGIIVSRAGLEYLITAFLRSFGISSADGIFIFLPLSNFQQRLLVYAALYEGADIAVTTHDYLFHDLKLFAPSFFVAPPVLFKNILKLFNLQREGGDSLPALLGGKLRFALVGMAPIEPQVIQEFHDNGILLLESYGLSESGVIAWNTPGHFKIGTVGLPLDAREVVLSEEQEVLVRRKAPLCLGYFDKWEDEGGIDMQTFRKDGLIATGDLACMDGEGYLILTGRKKNVVVTASGHKYQPEPIEKRINLLPLVNSSIVYHSTTRQCNVALINMDERPDAGTLAGLQAGIDKLNETLPDYQRIAKILANNDPYTVENKLLTGNLKLNRNKIIEKYSA
jgi:long-subunit acyl-CoA synthetase (AMP-forming)